jgi:hypothetical protein
MKQKTNRCKFLNAVSVHTPSSRACPCVYGCGCGCASGICAGIVEHGCVRRGRHGMENGKDKERALKVEWKDESSDGI